MGRRCPRLAWRAASSRPGPRRNPSHGVQRFTMKTRERFLTPEERQHVEATLLRGLQIPPGRKGHLDRRGVWALQLLSLTGLRRDEIRGLTWPGRLAAQLPEPPRHKDGPAEDLPPP